MVSTALDIHLDHELQLLVPWCGALMFVSQGDCVHFLWVNKWIKFLLDKMVQETLQAQDVGIGQGFEGDGGRGAKRKGWRNSWPILGPGAGLDLSCCRMQDPCRKVPHWDNHPTCGWSQQGKCGRSRAALIPRKSGTLSALSGGKKLSHWVHVTVGKIIT